MICMVMSKNGFRISGIVTMNVLLLMAVLGRMKAALPGSVAAVAGSATPIAAGQGSGSTSAVLTTAAASAAT